LRGTDVFPHLPELDAQEESEGDGSLTTKPPALELTEDAALSGIFELPEVPGSPKLDVASERLVVGKLANGAPIEFAAVGSRVEFKYDPRHAVFTQSLIEPVDCLVEELGYQILMRSSASQQEYPLSQVTASLRQKYFPWTLSSYEGLRDEASGLLDELTEFFTEALAPLAPLPLDSVSEDDRRSLSEVVARVDRAGEERVREVIENGEYPRYLGARCLPDLIARWPELVLDGQFLNVSFTDVKEKLRPGVMSQVLTTLRDVIWVANPDGVQAGGAEWRNMLGRAANSLRLVQAWKIAA
jgi:hypothetical protein